MYGENTYEKSHSGAVSLQNQILETKKHDMHPDFATIGDTSTSKDDILGWQNCTANALAPNSQQK